MNADIKKFLESGLLEQYFIGETNEAESLRVEHFLDTSEEVRAEYAAMQAAIERSAKEIATAPPRVLRSDILKEINTPTATIREIPKKNYWLMAASITAIIFGALSIYFYGNINELKKENLLAKNEITQLKSEKEKQENTCLELEEKFRLISHPDTRSFRLNGNEKSPELQIIAYWNETTKASLINLNSIPKLSGNKCFQIWADVDGKMLSVGILTDNKSNFQDLKYLPKATSLNVTIEPKGGSKHPDVSQLVANVVI